MATVRPIRETIPLEEARALLLDAARPIERTERIAIDGYREMSTFFGTADSTTRRMLETILAMEEEHAESTVTITNDDFAKLRRITFTWHSPAQFAEGDAELDVAANALSQEGPGRLYKALVYDQQIAQDVSAVQHSGDLG